MRNFLKKIKSKYTLYFLCFMALNLIEFLKATQRGNIWAAAANCTGLVMMVIIFSQLPVKDFLKPVNYVYTALCIAAMGVVRWHWTQHIGEYYFGQAITAVMNIWWLGLVIPYLFRKVIVEKKISLRVGGLGLSWFAFTAWTVISVAGKWWPIWFFLMFGAFYLVRFSEKDRTALLDAMIDGNIASFFVIQSYAYLFRPYDVVRYSGAFSNCNTMALYYLIIYCMVLFKLHLLHVRKAKLGWKVFYLIGAGGLLGFQFLTICRTAWAASIVVTLCYGLVVLRRAWDDRMGKLIARGCLLVLVAVLTFPAVFLTVRWLPTIHPHPIWYEGEWSPKRVHSWDPADSEKYVDVDEFFEAAVGRFYNMFKFLDAGNPFVLHAYAAEREQDIIKDNIPNIIPEPDDGWRGNSLSVRKVFFETYWKYSTWYGHPKEDGHYIFEKSKIYIWHGQNLWIEMIYRFGYPMVVFSTVLTIFALWTSFRKARTINADAYAAVPFIICVVFLVYGITEIVWNPGQLILVLVFFVMHPQFLEKSEE